MTAKKNPPEAAGIGVGVCPKGHIHIQFDGEDGQPLAVAIMNGQGFADLVHEVMQAVDEAPLEVLGKSDCAGRC